MWSVGLGSITAYLRCDACRATLDLCLLLSLACCPSWAVGLGGVVGRGWDELPGLAEPLLLTLPFAWGG